MIAASVIARVEALLATGWSHRRIAAELAISRDTVGRIAAGKIRSIDRASRAAHSTRSKIPATRCAGCGALVIESPCRACLVRHLVRHGAVSAASPASPAINLPPVGLELRAADERRYRKVRRARETTGAA